MLLILGFVAVFVLLQGQAPVPVYVLPLAVFTCASIASVLSIYHFRRKQKAYLPYSMDFPGEVPPKDPSDLSIENGGYVRGSGRYSMLYL